MTKYETEIDQLYVHHFKHPIWHIWVHVYWCKDRNRLWECLVINHDGPKTDINPIGHNLAGVVHNISRDGDKIIAISLPFEWDCTIDQYITISHECIHAAYSMHRIRKMPLPTMYPESHENDEEGICYLHDWIFQNIVDALNNQDQYQFNFSHETPKQQEERLCSL